MKLQLSLKIILISLVAVLLTSFLPGRPVLAAPQASTDFSALPALNLFIQEVQNGQAGELRGVYIPKILAVSVVQQPWGHEEYISAQSGVLTQFDLPSEFNATGLLAHNYLAGGKFSQLGPGRVFYLIYGDGKVSRYTVREVQNYRAVNPLSVTSSFVSLENNRLFSAGELFERIYDRPGQVILQTCIARDGESSWGRLFVIAEPLPAR